MRDAEATTPTPSNTPDPSAATTSPSRTRTVTWHDPRALAQAARGMSGLEVLRASADGTLPAPPMLALLDIRLADVSEGRVVFVANPAEYHYNPIGMVHGGLAATLLDSAMGCAIHSMLPAGTGYTTLEIKVNFVRAISSDTGPIQCEGTVIHLGGKVATAEARIVDATGKLYAHGTTTCLVLRA